MIFPAAVLHIPPVLATENIVFVSGAFRRTIFVSDLESFVKTGVPVGLLADLLKFSKQNFINQIEEKNWRNRIIQNEKKMYSEN